MTISERIYNRAKSYVGQSEWSIGANPFITKMITMALPWVDKNVDDSAYAWCGMFVAKLLRDEGYQGHIPKKYYRSLAWLDVGVEVELKDAIAGDICVFWRKHPKSGLGHVTLFSRSLCVDTIFLGGNQDNNVNYKDYPLDRLIKVIRIPENTSQSNKLSKFEEWLLRNM